MSDLTGFERFCSENGVAYRKNEPLRDHCTFAVGGCASIFIEAANANAAAKTIAAANALGAKLFVLGNGSNVLFPDEGFDGAVLHIGDGLSAMRLLDDCTILCESGASLKALCEFAYENGLAGLEFAYGIPGSVGGGIYMNAGAYGGELKDVLAAAHHISRDGSPGSFAGDAMGLAYRHSAYTDNDFVILSGEFCLKKGEKQAIRMTMDDFMQRRRDKQPLDVPSAGSTFRRPVGGYASALIDRCGLKGFSIGGAQVSEKHAGFVVNAGGATCKDILALIAHIQKTVKDKTGFALECEVKIVR